VAGATGETTAEATYHLKDASAARPAPVPAPAQDGADDGRPGEPSIGFFFDDSDDAELLDDGETCTPKEVNWSKF
jgi:hypothetical protein